MKAIKNIIDIVLTLVIIICVAVGGLYLFNIKPYVVLSGSMEPSYKVGSIIYYKSVDEAQLKVGDVITFYSRDKNNILYVYNLDVNVKDEDRVLSNINDINVRKVSENKYEFNVTGEEVIISRPVIVGAGPAGLTLGYMLSKYGYKPIIIEKGKRVEERKEDVYRFWNEEVLDESSNV